MLAGGEVAVDGGASDAELGGNLGDGVAAYAVVSWKPAPALPPELLARVRSVCEAAGLRGDLEHQVVERTKSLETGQRPAARLAEPAGARVTLGRSGPPQGGAG